MHEVFASCCGIVCDLVVEVGVDDDQILEAAQRLCKGDVGHHELGNADIVLNLMLRVVAVQDGNSIPQARGLYCNAKEMRRVQDNVLPSPLRALVHIRIRADRSVIVIRRVRAKRSLHDQVCRLLKGICQAVSQSVGVDEVEGLRG